MLLALSRMHQRYEAERGDSDIAGFHCLLYYGEMLTKALVACLVAGVGDDRERTRYSILYELVRADGVGDWEQALQAILVGRPSQNLREPFRPYQRELTERVPAGCWQHEAVERLHRAARILSIEVEQLPATVGARLWFSLFAQLRNKTRGHGAPRGAECSAALPELERSIQTLRDQLSVFRAPWAYLHRNLSGKYRVTCLGGDPAPFAYLKSRTDLLFQDGVYVFCGEPLQVDLAFSDTEATDFFLPNGQFHNDTFEILSYTTNERRRVDGTPYLRPAGILPDSETRGLAGLDLVGQLFSNLPPPPANYVRRPELESQLLDALQRERHEIVTLSGPGGAGKTSTAIRALHDLSEHPAGRFECVVWFSARDIDLLESGPKSVRPHGVTLEDFANEFVLFLQPPESSTKGFRPSYYLAQALATAPLGPTLFVFDNFETVADPPTLYRWLDTHIRPPNKVLITTRMREFAGDLPLQVRGMTEDEAGELINLWSQLLGIEHLLTNDYKTALYKEADGHPYVIKIMLGEVAKTGHLTKPERIVASREDILTALFERTYANLSPAAQRLFLLLSSWRSAVPTVCVEAVVLGNAEERIDVQAAVDELRRLSLIDETPAPDGQQFLTVPLAAAIFGKRKLPTHPYRLAIEADNRLLQNLGPTTKDQIRQGIQPRLQRLLRTIAARVSNGDLTLESQLPMLEFLASKLPSTWLNVARLCEEQGSPDWLERARDYLRRFIEAAPTPPDLADAWERLAALALRLGDHVGHVHALVSLCDVPGVDVERISNVANVLNNLLMAAKRDGRTILPPDPKRFSLEHVAAALERHHRELDATGFSRLAWLYLNLGDETRAAAAVSRGLQREPDNHHLLALRERGIGADA
jgi:tetratricopeptide (TPR) repeat protein